MVATPLNVECRKVSAEIHARWLEHVVRRLRRHGPVHGAGHLNRRVYSITWREKDGALQRKSQLCIPFLRIARPQSQFPHSCVCERITVFYILRIGSHIFQQQNRQIESGNIEIAHSYVNVEIGIVAAQFLFWEYLFRIFGILSLQCGSIKVIT
jgi:hypothetical protein